MKQKNTRGRNGSKKQTTLAKKLAKEQMIREANARHDAQYGANPTIIDYYTTLHKTGLR